MTEYKVNAIAMKTDRAARRWNSFGQTAVKKNMVVKYIHDNSPIPIPAIFAPLDLLLETTQRDFCLLHF